MKRILITLKNGWVGLDKVGRPNRFESGSSSKGTKPIENKMTQLTFVQVEIGVDKSVRAWETGKEEGSGKGEW